MTLILASEPITAKRIIFRIQSKKTSASCNLLSPSFSLSLSLPSLRYVSARAGASQQTKNNNKIYIQKIAQVIPFLSIFKRRLYDLFVIEAGTRAPLICLVKVQAA